MKDQPHDALFQETFRDKDEAAAVLRAVLPADVVELFDWESLRLESANLTVAGRTRHCDLLFTVGRTGRELPTLVFVLFEHQSTEDPLMALRMLRYMVRAWEIWVDKTKVTRPPLPPILPVVLAHVDGGWRSARRFGDLFGLDSATLAVLGRFLPDFEFALDDLCSATDEQLEARSLPPGSALTLWALRDGRSPDKLIAHVPFWAHLFETLGRLPGGEAVSDRIIEYLGRAAGEHSVAVEAFVREVVKYAPKARQIVMDSFDRFTEKARNEGLQKGRNEGLQKGRKEGLQRGRRETLLKQLRHKFGALSDEDVARVEQADDATLDRCIERILTADSIAAVLGS